MKKILFLGISLLSMKLGAAAEPDLVYGALGLLGSAVQLKPGAVLSQANFSDAIKGLSTELKRRYNLPELRLSTNIKIKKVSSLHQKAAADCGLYAAFHMGLFLREEKRLSVPPEKELIAQYADFKQRYLEWVKNDAWAYNPQESDTGNDFAAYYISTSVINGYFYVCNGLEDTKKVHIFEYTPSNRDDIVEIDRVHEEGQPLVRDDNDIQDPKKVTVNGVAYIRHFKRYNYADNLLVNQLQQSCYAQSDNEAVRQLKEAKELILLRIFRSAPREAEVGTFDQRRFIKEWYHFFTRPYDQTPLYCIVTNAGHFNAVKFYKKNYQVYADVRDSIGLAENNVTFVYNTMLNLFKTGQLKKYYEAALDDARFVVEYPKGSSVPEFLQELIAYGEGSEAWENSLLIAAFSNLIVDSREPGFWQRELSNREFLIYFRSYLDRPDELASLTCIIVRFEKEGDVPVFETDKEDLLEWSSRVKIRLMELYQRVAGKMSS